MAKTVTEVSLAGLQVDKSEPFPLHLQLYENIRLAILAGRLRPGQKLPATRLLAEELRISRNRVTLAFEQLILEGYLDGRVGAGTYVADQLPEKRLQSDSLVRVSAQSVAPLQPNHTLDFGLSKELLQRNKTCENVLPFQTGIPAFDAFPYPIWAKLANQVYRDLSRLPLGYGDAAGFYPLREAIAGYLRTARAVRCEAENILITTGSQQGLNLVAAVLLKPGEAAWMEDPGYHGARAAMVKAGLQICPVPVTQAGLDLTYATGHCPEARLLYLTPSHQYPLGGTMPLPQRLQLLDWARQHPMWILEDDYDSELRYAGRPLASLQGLDQGKSVIYLGTFSKVLFPALRIGYLVLPTPELLDAFISAKAMLDRQNPVVEQAILARFIAEGHFARHLRKMRTLYLERQKIILQEAQKQLKDLLTVVPSDAGMHLVGWLPDGANDREASQAAARHGVIVHPVSDYMMQHATRPGLLLGYTSFREADIRKGIGQLAAALRSVPGQ